MIGRLVLAAVLGSGLLLEIAVTVSTRPPLLFGLFTVLANGVVCLAAMLRRRGPAIAATVAIGLILAVELAGVALAVPDRGEPAPVGYLAMLIVLGTAMRRLRLAGAALAWAGGAAPALVAQSMYTSTVALVMLAGWGIAVGAGAWLRIGDARQRSLRESVRRSERVALARDLHDVAAHHLTALIIQAQAGQVGPGDSRAVLGEIETAGVEALNSLRRLARLLRDEEDPETPPGTVAELVAAFGRRGQWEGEGAGTSGVPAESDSAPGAADAAGGTAVRLEMPDGPQPEDWSPEVATGVYRIVQEALTNVARHARTARHVTVTLAHDARSIRLTVTDDGDTGAPARPDDGGSSGRGLHGMRERAAALGGTLTAGRTGPGWTVRAVIPAPRPVAADAGPAAGGRARRPSWRIWR